MRAIKFKLTGLVLGLFTFFTVLLLPPSGAMLFYGAKTVLSHSEKEILKKIGHPSSEKNLKYSEFDEILKKAENIKVKIPKNFSKSGTRGIKIDNKTGKTLSEIFNIQANALKATLAIALLMAIWWITEAIPIPITSMLPLLLFPLLSIGNPKSVSFPGFFNPFYPYMHYLIVLFLAGFTIAEAMKRWNLHRRISLYFLSKISFSPKKVIFAFMIITAFLSMFISNTATTAMMLPIGLGIIAASTKGEGKNNFGKVLMLGIAYASSIGGIGTLIGTPPNVVLAGFVDNLLGIKITFGNWILIGLPLTIFMLPLAFLVLIKVFPLNEVNIKDSKKVIEEDLKKMGKLTVGEKNTLIIFLITAFLWIFEKKIKAIFHLNWVNDAVVGVFAIVLFYIIPVNLKKWEFTLNWETNKKLPWGTLLLFGGGFSLGTALDKTGAASYLAGSLTIFKNIPLIIILFLTVLLMVFLTEITSNTASTNMMLPILFSIGITTSTNPLVLMIAGAIGASMAFMLPVATPPNALIFGSGYIKMKDMIKAGILLNIISIILITSYLYLLSFVYLKNF